MRGREKRGKWKEKKKILTLFPLFLLCAYKIRLHIHTPFFFFLLSLLAFLPPSFFSPSLISSPLVDLSIDAGVWVHLLMGNEVTIGEQCSHNKKSTP